jgi:hypothetical protein
MLRSFFKGVASGVGIVLGVMFAIILMQLSAYVLQLMGIFPA